MCIFVVFFFKQKTAYEMRISDWSSDVCSSDLIPGDGAARQPGGGNPLGPASARCASRREQAGPALRGFPHTGPRGAARARRSRPRGAAPAPGRRGRDGDGDAASAHVRSDGRSEEHTSELQSLMRISYAVFCLKKKKNRMLSSTTNTHNITRSVQYT